ncbi:MAG: hypothetical protein JO352_03250 [Chloroflexi bacterium]|nr:hypothetical protein [Chloroflexota bacterium]MBV9601579.1 hypothetical protein [Chloroflexota bacterium]
MEHRETLDARLPTPDDEGRRLAASELLLRFSVDDEVLFEDDVLAEEHDLETPSIMAQGRATSGGDVPVLAVDIWSFRWPAPFRQGSRPAR